MEEGLTTEEWKNYQAEKRHGRALLPDTVRLICEAHNYDAEQIGQYFLELLPRICPVQTR